MIGTAIIVIDGSRILRNLDSEYERKRTEWQINCSAVHARFRKKRYEENGNGGLKSVGKEEPDYTKYYPPELKPMISFKYREYDGHALLEEKDYTANQAMFRNCLAFPIKECLNFNHTLYKNPLTVPLSVRNDSGISVRPPGCRGDGDCDSCVIECTSELEEDSDED